MTQHQANLILLNWQNHRHLPKEDRPVDFDYEAKLEAVREAVMEQSPA